MQITVSRNELAEAYAWTKRNLPKRTVLPILAGIIVSVDEAGRLNLSTFDFETSGRTWIDGELALPGRILVHGAYLGGIISALPKGVRERVTLSADDERLIITSGKTSWKLPALPIGEYPQFPVLPELSGVIDGKEFAKAVEQVGRAAGRDDTLPILTGIHLDPVEGAVTFAATDRYRLAVKRVEWVAGTPAAPAIIPVAPLVQVAKPAGKAGTKVSIHLSTDVVGLVDDRHELTTRPISGEFVRYKERFPTEFVDTVTVDAGTLAGAIDRVSVTAERGQPVELRYTDGVVTAGTYSAELEATEPVDATTESGADLKIGFCPAYMLDALAGFTGQVRVGFNGSNKPVTVSADSDALVVLLVPQRVAEPAPVPVEAKDEQPEAETAEEVPAAA